MQTSLQQLSFLLCIKITLSFHHTKVLKTKTKTNQKTGNRIWHFCFFSAQPFGTGSLQTLSFCSHNFHLFQYKSRLRVKVPKYNCNFHFWVMNVVLKVTRRQWHYHYEIYKQTMKFSKGTKVLRASIAPQNWLSCQQELNTIHEHKIMQYSILINKGKIKHEMWNGAFQIGLQFNEGNFKLPTKIS